MPINTLDLRKAVAAQVGAEGTQRYTDQRDYIPGINGALRQLQAIMRAMLAERKESEKAFSELVYDRVFQTNSLGGITLSKAELGHSVFCIVAMYAEPKTTPASPSFLIIPADKSKWRDDLIWRPGGKRVKRMTKEQIAQADQNPFMSGNSVPINTDLVLYAYYEASDRSGTVWNPGDYEVIITPEQYTKRTFVAVTYLRDIEPITTIDANTYIPLPASLFNLMRDLVLHELTPKQGDHTTLYEITRRAIAELFAAQS